MIHRQTQRHGMSPARGRKSAARPPTMACASSAPNRYFITNLCLIVLLLATACLGAALPALHGQPSGCPPMPIDCWSPSDCTITTTWSLDLDLDQDGTADFRQVRWTAEQRCYDSNPPFSSFQRDTAEALFAVNGVEMNMMLHPYQDGAIATVKFGQTIPPEPDPQPADGLYWAWVKPQDSVLLSTLGLGYSERFTDHDPCPEINCMRFSYVGVMTWTNQVYFGFRIPKAGNWHLGWLRVELTPMVQTPDGRWTSVTLVDYAVQPEPDTAIRVGEHPRPALSVARVQSEVRVSWPAVWTGYTLESTRALGGGWAPVPGVTNNAVTLPATDAPWYFRLRR